MELNNVHLSYCTNVHPAETYEELLSMLQNDVLTVKKLIGFNDSFGVGLRLSAQMVMSMSPSHVSHLKDTLVHHGLYVFSVNGFPYGDFGVGVVKANVYEPGWHLETRLEYTKTIADILVQLPGPARRSISTVALGFKPTFETKELQRKAVKNLRACLTHLAELKNRTGIDVQLCLEPEPGTFLELSSDVVAFFTEHGFVAESRENRHLSVCYDTCHQAVMFEDAVECIETLSRNGIRIGKMQISNAIALKTPNLTSARQALATFNEPRFLHQVVSQTPPIFALDLPEIQQQPKKWHESEEWRCHFHVPLHWKGDKYLETTSSQWSEALAYVVENHLCEHFEIETYTWHVLPNHAFGNGSIAEKISEEFKVVLPFFRSQT